MAFGARMYWKADASKTSHCLVRILVERDNFAIFLRKWIRRGRYSQWRSLLGHVERIFVHKNWRGRYWQHLVSTGGRYVPQSRSFLKIALSASELMSFGHLEAAIWHRWTIICGGAVKDKCYVDKPKSIDVVKDNIREAIGEIRLHTIDNVLKNWTDRVGYCMAIRGNHLNEIVFPY